MLKLLEDCYDRGVFLLHFVSYIAKFDGVFHYIQQVYGFLVLQ